MSDEQLPTAGGKLTADSFGTLAIFAAGSCPGVTLVLTAIDDEGMQWGQLLIVDTVVEPQGRRAALNRVISKCYGPIVGVRVRVIYAFVEQDASGTPVADVSIADAFGVAGRN